MPKISAPWPRRVLLLIAALLVIWFGPLNYRHLVKPDEGRYAEIPREMVTTGDWLTPHLNGVLYFEKPALQYWATAAAYEVFGQHEWTARLWPALTGFAGLLLVGFTGLRLFDRRAGLYGALVLASSFLYVGIGHINTLDMGVTFFMALSLCGLLLAQRPGASPRENRNWMLATWAAMGFSMLSKGLIGIVLPGAVLVLYTLIERDWRLWRRLHLGKGLLLFAVIALPWFVAVSLRNPDFFHFFFIHEHFERFLTKEAHRVQPWYFFIVILLAGMLPWTFTMLGALRHAWQADSPTATFKPQRLLLIWSVFIFAFFSISDSKLPSYILPIFPSLALLMGAYLTRLRDRTIAWQFAPVAVLALAGLVAAPQAIHTEHNPLAVPLLQHYIYWAMAALLLLLAGLGLAIWLLRRGRRTPALVAASLMTLVAFQVAINGHESFAPRMSAYALAQVIKPYVRANAPFYSVYMYDQTLPYYIHHTFIQVQYEDELAFGLQHAPQRYLPDLQAFEKVWAKQPYALAIMTPDIYQVLQQAHLPMQVIANDGYHIVIKTPGRLPTPQ
jgi:4-amino-4-deoxy-L-arabinose transferase-like glycosyltransferase